MNVCSKCGAPAEFHADNAPSEGFRCGDCAINAADLEYVSALGEEIGEVLGEPVGEECDYEEGDEEE